MNKVKAIVCIAAIFLFLAPSGAWSNDRTQRHYEFGKAYRELFRAQVINPQAPRDRSPVSGMPGYIAVQIYNERYLPAIGGEESGRISGGVGMSRKGAGYW